MSFHKIGTLFATAALFFSQAVAASAQTLTFSDYGPNRGTRAAAVQWFADEIKNRSSGRLKVEIHWGGALLDGKSTLKGLKDNVADMGTVIGYFAPKELIAYNIGDLPFANSDPWIGMRALFDTASTNRQMQKEFEKAGVVYVSNYTTGPIQLICRKAVSNLADLRGLKVRGSGAYGKAMADFGAIQNSMSQADVFQALDSGVIDCNQNYYYGIKSYKQYEVASHVLALDWGQNMSFGIFMSRIAYARLDVKDQALIREVGRDFIDYFARMMIEESDTNKAELKAGIGGKQIILRELPAEDRVRLTEIGEKYVSKWVEEAKGAGVDSAALLADYKKRVEHYTTEKTRENYPWKR